MILIPQQFTLACSVADFQPDCDDMSTFVLYSSFILYNHVSVICVPSEADLNIWAFSSHFSYMIIVAILL